MAGSVLQIGATVDLANLQAGMEAAVSTVNGACDQMAQGFARLQGSSLIVSRDLASELGRVGENAGAITPRLRDVGNAGSNAGREARGGFALLNEELRIGLSRHLRGWLATLPGVGAAMSAAFSTLAVIGVIEVVVEAGKKIYEFIESLHKLSDDEKKAIGEVADQTKSGIELSKTLLAIDRERILVGKSSEEQARLKAQWAREDAKWNEKQLELVQRQYEEAKKIQELYESGATRPWREGDAYSTNSRTGQISHQATVPLVSNGQMKDAEATIKSLEDVWGKGLEKISSEAAVSSARVGVAEAEAANAAAEGAKRSEAADRKRMDSALKVAAIIAKSHADLEKQIEAERVKEEKSADLTLQTELKQQAEANSALLKSLHEQTQAEIVAAENEQQEAQRTYEYKRTLIDGEYNAHEISAGKRLQLLRKALDEEYKAEYDALVKKLELQANDPNVSREEFQRTMGAIHKLDQQYKLESLKLSQTYANQNARIWQTMGQQMSQSMRTAIGGWIQGTQTFAQAWNRTILGMASTFVESFANRILSSFTQMIARKLAIHVATNQAEVASDAAAAEESTAISLGASLKQITHDAGVSAAHAFKAVMEALPFPANVIVAPVAAAGAFAAVMAFGSAAGGTEVDRDQLMMVHEKELILPANISQGLKGMISGWNGNSAAPQRGSMPQVTIQQNVSAIDGQSVSRFLRNNRRAMTKEFGRMVRNGALRPAFAGAR
jgi:hypothetical protein